MTEPGYQRATRAGYDTFAVDYAAHFKGEMEREPVGRAIIGAFAELVRAEGDGPVLDVGSGPGRVTALLHDCGLDVSGVDLSPEMVRIAGEEQPHLRFEVGTMTALDVADGGLRGLVAWYSIIHIAPEDLPTVFAEFHRVLADGGRLLLGFQVGDEVLHHEEAFGKKISLDFRRLSVDRISELLDQAGFSVRIRLVREPEDWEKVPQAQLVATKIRA